MKKRRKLIPYLALANVLVLSGFVYRLLTRPHITPEQLQVAKTMDSLGVMPVDEYFRIIQIRKTINSTHSISDPDLDWCLARMQISGTSPNADAPSLRRLTITDDWSNLVETTPGQREKLFQMSCNYLPHVGAGYLTTADKLIGLDLALLSKDKRAIPFVLPLLQDRDPDVRDIAHVDLPDLGFKA